MENDNCPPPTQEVLKLSLNGISATGSCHAQRWNHTILFYKKKKKLTRFLWDFRKKRKTKHPLATNSDLKDCINQTKL